jgi:hypothetical protein
MTVNIHKNAIMIQLEVGSALRIHHQNPRKEKQNMPSFTAPDYELRIRVPIALTQSRLTINRSYFCLTFT